MTKIERYELIIEKHKKENGYMYAFINKNKITLSVKSLRKLDELLKEIKEIIK